MLKHRPPGVGWGPQLGIKCYKGIQLENIVLKTNKVEKAQSFVEASIFKFDQNHDLQGKGRATMEEGHELHKNK